MAFSLRHPIKSTVGAWFDKKVETTAAKKVEELQAKSGTKVASEILDPKAAENFLRMLRETIRLGSTTTTDRPLALPDEIRNVVVSEVFIKAIEETDPKKIKAILPLEEANSSWAAQAEEQRANLAKKLRVIKRGSGAPDLTDFDLEVIIATMVGTMVVSSVGKDQEGKFLTVPISWNSWPLENLPNPTDAFFRFLLAAASTSQSPGLFIHSVLDYLHLKYTLTTHTGARPNGSIIHPTHAEAFLEEISGAAREIALDIIANSAVRLYTTPSNELVASNTGDPALDCPGYLVGEVDARKTEFDVAKKDLKQARENLQRAVDKLSEDQKTEFLQKQRELDVVQEAEEKALNELLVHYDERCQAEINLITLALERLEKKLKKVKDSPAEKSQLETLRKLLTEALEQLNKERETIAKDEIPERRQFSVDSSVYTIGHALEDCDSELLGHSWSPTEYFYKRRNKKIKDAEDEVIDHQCANAIKRCNAELAILDLALRKLNKQITRIQKRIDKLDAKLSHEHDPGSISKLAAKKTKLQDKLRDLNLEKNQLVRAINSINDEKHFIFAGRNPNRDFYYQKEINSVLNSCDKIFGRFISRFGWRVRKNKHALEEATKRMALPISDERQKYKNAKTATQSAADAMNSICHNFSELVDDEFTARKAYLEARDALFIGTKLAGRVQDLQINFEAAVEESSKKGSISDAKSQFAPADLLKYSQWANPIIFDLVQKANDLREQQAKLTTQPGSDTKTTTDPLSAQVEKIEDSVRQFMAASRNYGTNIREICIQLTAVIDSPPAPNLGSKINSQIGELRCSLIDLESYFERNLRAACSYNLEKILRATTISERQHLTDGFVSIFEPSVSAARGKLENIHLQLVEIVVLVKELDSRQVKSTSQMIVISRDTNNTLSTALGDIANATSGLKKTVNQSGAVAASAVLGHAQEIAKYNAALDKFKQSIEAAALPNEVKAEFLEVHIALSGGIQTSEQIGKRLESIAEKHAHPIPRVIQAAVDSITRKTSSDLVGSRVRMTYPTNKRARVVLRPLQRYASPVSADQCLIAAVRWRRAKSDLQPAPIKAGAGIREALASRVAKYGGVSIDLRNFGRALGGLGWVISNVFLPVLAHPVGKGYLSKRGYGHKTIKRKGQWSVRLGYWAWLHQLALVSVTVAPYLLRDVIPPKLYYRSIPSGAYVVPKAIGWGVGYALEPLVRSSRIEGWFKRQGVWALYDDEPQEVQEYVRDSVTYNSSTLLRESLVQMDDRYFHKVFGLNPQNSSEDNLIIWLRQNPDALLALHERMLGRRVVMSRVHRPNEAPQIGEDITVRAPTASDPNATRQAHTLYNYDLVTEPFADGYVLNRARAHEFVIFLRQKATDLNRRVTSYDIHVGFREQLIASRYLITQEERQLQREYGLHDADGQLSRFVLLNRAYFDQQIAPYLRRARAAIYLKQDNRDDFLTALRTNVVRLIESQHLDLDVAAEQVPVTQHPTTNRLVSEVFGPALEATLVHAQTANWIEDCSGDYNRRRIAALFAAPTITDAERDRAINEKLGNREFAQTVLEPIVTTLQSTNQQFQNVTLDQVLTFLGQFQAANATHRLVEPNAARFLSDILAHATALFNAHPDSATQGTHTEAVIAAWSDSLHQAIVDNSPFYAPPGRYHQRNMTSHHYTETPIQAGSVTTSATPGRPLLVLADRQQTNVVLLEKIPLDPATPHRTLVQQIRDSGRASSVFRNLSQPVQTMLNQAISQALSQPAARTRRGVATQPQASIRQPNDEDRVKVLSYILGNAEISLSSPTPVQTAVRTRATSNLGPIRAEAVQRGDRDYVRLIFPTINPFNSTFDPNYMTRLVPVVRTALWARW